MTKLQMKLKIIFYNAQTINGCRAGLMSLDGLERQAATLDDSDMIRDAMEILWNKGNRLIAEGRA